MATDDKPRHAISGAPDARAWRFVGRRKRLFFRNIEHLLPAIASRRLYAYISRPAMVMMSMTAAAGLIYA